MVGGGVSRTWGVRQLRASKTGGRWRQVDGRGVATILLTPSSSLFALWSSTTPWRLADRPYCVMFDFERAPADFFTPTAQLVPLSSSSSYMHRVGLMGVLIATVCLAVDRCVHIQPGGGSSLAPAGPTSRCLHGGCVSRRLDISGRWLLGAPSSRHGGTLAEH